MKKLVGLIIALLPLTASGKVPVTLIKDRVIIEAKALLSSTQMSVREIADVLHFQTDSFFCRYFRQKTGMTPTAFREGQSAPESINDCA